MHLNRVASLRSAGALLAFALPATAQVVPVVPYARTMDLFVVDTSNDALWRLCDFDQDGTFHGPGEVTLFYDETAGAFAWSSPSCVFFADDGTAYVGDVSTDVIYALRDANGDGDASDPGEHRVFFDASNASGLSMQQSQGIVVDALGHVYVAVSNPSGGALDGILRLRDLNGNGDANDAGEANYYYTVPGSGASAAFSVPTKIAIGPDLALYFTDVGTGAGQRGVWRLFDVDGSGDCNGPGEASLYWNPTLQANPSATNAQYWSLAFDQIGAVYVTDHINELVWRGFDANGDSAIQTSEQTLFYQTTGSTWWDLVVRDDGALWLVDSDPSDDIVTVLQDLNNDFDALDAGEATLVYDAGLAAQGIAVRGAAAMRAASLQLSPPTVAIGNVTTYFVRTSKPIEIVAPALALGLVQPISLAPFGQLEIDPLTAIVLGVTVSDANGNASFALPVPADPALVGSFGAQALCGDFFRLFLSNPAALTVTP